MKNLNTLNTKSFRCVLSRGMVGVTLTPTPVKKVSCEGEQTTYEDWILPPDSRVKIESFNMFKDRVCCFVSVLGVRVEVDYILFAKNVVIINTNNLANVDSINIQVLAKPILSLNSIICVMSLLTYTGVIALLVKVFL